MWVGVVFVLLAVPACRGAGYSAYQYYETGGDRDADFYDNYDDDVHRVPTATTMYAGAYTRNKRYGDMDDIRTLDPKEIHDVKGALNKILYGNKLESLLTHPDHKDYTDIYDYIDKTDSRGQDTKNDSGDHFRGKVQKWSPSELSHMPSSVHIQHWSPHIEVQKWSTVEDSQETPQATSSTYSPKEVKAELEKLVSPADATQKWSPSFDIRQPTATEQTWMPSDDVTQDSTPETRTYSNEEVKEDIKKLLAPGVLPRQWTTTIGVHHWSPDVQHWSANDNNEQTLSNTMSEHTEKSKQETELDIQSQALRPKTGRSKKPNYIRQYVRETDKYGNQKYDKSKTFPTGPPGNQTRETVDHGTITKVTPIKNEWQPDDYETTAPFIEVTTEHRETVNATWSFYTTSTIHHSNFTGTTTEGRTASVETKTTGGDSDATSGDSDATSGDSNATSGETQTVDSNKTVATVTRVTTVNGTATMRITTKSPRVDINAIIAIIANLTYDYDWNLTEQFNKTLIDHGVPTCPTPSTPTTTTTTPPQYDFANTSVVGKCFVCGLKTVEIPRNAFCADAFAGDFLPLVPVDPRARGQIASFRKYCRHLDVHNYVENPSEPRSIYGRFTGGCGVRWTDLSGVYTQRTCRSRFRPLTGKHFGSKRMAKLELALVNVENGCIISPMATLLPLSRGISLYARFHACVCTGSWCNRAVRMRDNTRALTLTLRAAIALLVCYANYIT